MCHGGQQTWGQDYWETYAPIVTWVSVCLLLIVAKIHGIELKSIDFVLAFPQADLDVPVYMEFPAGVNPVIFWMRINFVMFSSLTKSLWTQASRLQLV